MLCRIAGVTGWTLSPLVGLFPPWFRMADARVVRLGNLLPERPAPPAVTLTVWLRVYVCPCSTSFLRPPGFPSCGRPSGRGRDDDDVVNFSAYHIG